MTPDQILDRMLKFAVSPECPPDRKREVENGAWRTWAYAITERNPFAYEKVKHEKFTIRDCIKWSFNPEKIAQIDITLQPNKPRKQYEYKTTIIKTNEHRKKPVININTFHHHMSNESILIESLYKYDIIVIMRERTPFTAHLINNLPNLKLLITSGMRNKSIDL